MLIKKEVWQPVAGVLFFIVVAGSAAALLGHDDITPLVASAGIWAPLLLITLKIATIVISPLGGTPIYFAVPALFGFWPSFMYLVLADVIGYSAVFWISRIYGKRIMNRMLSESQIAWADRMLSRIGTWKRLMAVRVIFSPFADTISYAAGLTKITFKAYFWSTLPLLILHVLITNQISKIFIKSQLGYIGVVLVVMTVPFIIYLARHKIKKLFPGSNIPTDSN